jgi:hypothetical protein
MSFDPSTATIFTPTSKTKFDPNTVGVSTVDKEEDLTTSETIEGIGLKLLDGVAFGFGDELSAALRVGLDEMVKTVAPEVVPTGTAEERYQRYLSRSQGIEERFEKEAPIFAGALEIGSSLVPAAKIGTAVGNMATRLGNIGVQSGLAGGEMVVREFAEAEGDFSERVEGIDWTNVGIGAGAGAIAGVFMRGQNSVDALAAKEKAARTASGNVTEVGLADKSRLNAGIRHIRDDLYANTKEEVGVQSARQMVDADAQATQWKQAIHNEENLPIKKLDNLTKVLKSSGKVRKLIGDAGAVKQTDEGYSAVFSPQGRQKRLDVAARELEKINPEAAKTFAKMRSTIELVQRDMRRVFPKAAEEFEEGYFPLYKQAESIYKGFFRSGGKARASSSAMQRTTGFITEQQALETFQDPVASFMSFYEDSIDALALARKFNVKVENKNLKSINSYTDEVIKAIGKSKTKELGEEGASRLMDNLRLFALDGRESMGQLANFLRMASHSALLGTPENAVLQAGDLGQAAYASSFKSAVKALPKALKSVLLTDGDMVVSSKGYEGILRMADLGFTRQHLTEMVNENKAWLPKQMSKLADVLMSVSLVKSANRLGVETFMNAQVNELKNLAKQGRDALAKSEFTEGLTEQQIDRLFKGINSGNVKDKAVREAVFFKVGRFQPVSRTSMPPSYLNMRNGRLLWSMRMYMTKMASRFNEDVLKPVYEAERAGLNTDKGRSLMRKALINTGRYSSFILALNAIVDPGRKEIFRGKESPNEFGSEVMRQASSFATGGLVDPDLITYGFSPSETLAPPAIAAGGSLIEVGIKALQEGEVTPEQMKRAAMFVPVARQIMWTDEVLEESPLVN